MPHPASLRPGIALGPYPQRQDEREGWLDRAAASLMGLIRQKAYGRRPGHERFLRLVESQANSLAGLQDAQLKALVPPLRQQLQGEGLQDALIARAFAIVREVATRRLGMRPFDVQLIGGRVMLDGKVAEMETGEGKTLTATLPACAAALAGIPVHIVTVNDFLVLRDAAWMNPLYTFLGLTVGTITEGMAPDERRRAYACHVTYGTNKQVVFDYLRDRLMLGRGTSPIHSKMESLYADKARVRGPLLRGLCFVIVDEADSILVDEARTPLIISSKADPMHEEQVYAEAMAIARQLTSGLDFSLQPRRHEVELSERGKRRLAELARPYGDVWMGPRRREELARRALSALHLFHRDKQYLVRGDKIQIVDEYTGRVMADRSWERGLHQMIEAKEGVPITGQQETLARISYQRLFRRYLRVAGMTGTAREVGRELWSVYRLPVVTIPTHRPARRRILQERVFAQSAAKWQAVVASVREIQATGRPVLIGTRSVAASEHLSGLLQAADIAHQVLNARQDQEEAAIVARAGESGRVTVATNMAGRGTDIRLAPEVVELGGLHVIATERHDAGRIDRQLLGRCGRQGDPGTFQVFGALDDELVRDHFTRHTRTLLAALGRGGKPLPGWLGAWVMASAQQAAERLHGRTRRRLLKADEQMGDLLAFTGRSE
jgi:preprotein translocase subunit SecA